MYRPISWSTVSVHIGHYTYRSEVSNKVLIECCSIGSVSAMDVSVSHQSSTHKVSEV